MIPQLLIALPYIAIVINLILMRRKHQATLPLQILMSLLLFSGAIFTLMRHTTTIIYFGNWPASIGIQFNINVLTQLFLSVFALCLCFVFIFSLKDRAIRQKTLFSIGAWMLTAGAYSALCTNDLFNLYVWTEIMLVSAFLLICASQHITAKHVWKYAAFNILSTLMILLSIALLYGLTGTLDMTQIGIRLHTLQQPVSAQLYILLLVLGLSIKSALFPFYFWLPDMYEETSPSVNALLASFITKTMLVIMLMIYWRWFGMLSIHFSQFFIAIACFTMLLGVLGAASFFDMKRILCFHIISQIGYILLAIMIHTTLAIVACLFFIIHNMLTKSALLMVSGHIENNIGNTGLKSNRINFVSNPILGTLFLIAALSLAGIPPLSGFWAKLFVIEATVATHHFLAVTIAAIVSLFTLYSMIKIWRFMFCNEGQSQKSHEATPLKAISPLIAIGGMTLCMLAISLNPSLLLAPLHQSAQVIIQLGGHHA